MPYISGMPRKYIRTKPHAPRGPYFPRNCRECGEPLVANENWGPRQVKIGHLICLDCNREQIRLRRNPSMDLLRFAKSRAKALGVAFDLDNDDIVIPEVCPALGIPIVIGAPGRHHGTPSLDRIIPSLGYTKGNVQVISWRANQLKSDATADEIVKIADWISKLI